MSRKVSGVKVASGESVNAFRVVVDLLEPGLGRGQTTVSRTTPADRIASTPRSAATPASRGRLAALDVLVLSAWCGLAAGLLEVGTRVLCRTIDPTERLYEMSRHFVWLTPLANLLVFLALGFCLAGITRFWPRFGGWLGPRLLTALAMLPTFMVAGPRIFPEAWFVLALGIAIQAVPWLERHIAGFLRLLVWSFPALLGLVLILAGSVFGGDWLKHRREAGRALPPADSPNVIFIVLDTVRADHLSLYGYRRSTTPNLERLARRGIRFDAARAAAPWTLASHATFFTGHWPHELDVKWLTPLRRNFPMLAEYLGLQGYATAGFVANVLYCSYDAGLDRGFTHYEDYVLEKLNPLRTSVLVEEALRTFFIVAARHETGPVLYVRELVRRWFSFAIRRNARSISRGFLDWLDRRSEPGRPFFVFLNYLDAHTPYELPAGAQHRFGRRPQTRDELRLIYEEWPYIDKLALPRHYVTLAGDCYDNCLADLDEQLGHLFDDLERRGVMDRTWVVITSDHGEGLGEHDLFEHGESLYSTEIHVPLLLLAPSGSRQARVVSDAVSLRDLPATVLELVGRHSGSPFPGRSLSSLWRDGSTDRTGETADGVVFSELPVPTPSDPSHGRSPARRGPLVSLAEGEFVYIRNDGDGTEELYNVRDDPRELTNRALSIPIKPVLERFRARMAEIKK